MGLLYAMLYSLLRYLFGKKPIEERAVETLIEEREGAIRGFENANKIRDRLRDPDYRNVVREHYARKDD